MKYPFKLRLLWFLMSIGIRTSGMSSEAHRIYNGLKTCSDTPTSDLKSDKTNGE